MLAWAMQWRCERYRRPRRRRLWLPGRWRSPGVEEGFADRAIKIKPEGEADGSDEAEGEGGGGQEADDSVGGYVAGVGVFTAGVEAGGYPKEGNAFGEPADGDPAAGGLEGDGDGEEGNG